MSDGHHLRQSWSDALGNAETNFRRLLTSSSTTEWKHIVATLNDKQPPNVKGKGRATFTPELRDVVIHRKSGKSGDNTYRAILDVPVGDDSPSLDAWRSVLATPELRQEWDPAVEGAHVIELLDTATRISKTNFTLGWPANPRDAVTISRLFHDDSTVIDIATSLPRSVDEPAYLRPSPPYVRSNVALFAWCIQRIQPVQPQLSEGAKKRLSQGNRLRIMCFWQHDFRTMWTTGSSSTLAQQLATMVIGLYKTVAKRATRVPTLTGYGGGVSVERIRFQADREALTIDYAIVPEDEDHPYGPTTGITEVPELQAVREKRRLTRSIECSLPSPEGWDVQISTKASSERVQKLPWTAQAIQSTSTPLSGKKFDKIVFRVTHSPLLDDHSVLKVRVVLERSGPSSGLRLNGLSQPILEVGERDPFYFISQDILRDVSSTAGQSFQTASSVSTADSATTSSSKGLMAPVLNRAYTERSSAVEKTILSRVKRNYIYFSSLLQEPEAKWKRTTEARGVSITQLDSIDPTLVVYRAEATFVGVGLWDLYGALTSPGARNFWDKQHEDAFLLEDVNELTELWHYKARPAWPANGRDSVVLKTVYKSPTTIHVFSFSADDPHLFPNIPPTELNIIRMQIDLQGWAIEALSPTTTLLTLLEQSDPKGWSNKAAIPSQMINAVAGVGDFAIKCGGPPIVTRLAGAKINDLRYDHEKGNFKVEYEASAARQTSNGNAADADNALISSAATAQTIECEIRCDLDTWASSLDIVVDPPPLSVSALRRHRLSLEGGGLWLTVVHDAVPAGDERLLALVRRGPGVSRERGLVMVNGARVSVDADELAEHEIKSLAKQKRVKPARVPLDQPPVVGAMRRRRAEWDEDGAVEGAAKPEKQLPPSPSKTGTVLTSNWPSAPLFSSPLARMFTTAMEQATTTTQQAVAAIAPSESSEHSLTPFTPPMQYALDALSWMLNNYTLSNEDWTLVGDKDIAVHRRLAPEISPAVQVHKGEKVIEGVSAEELASVITSYGCRKQWDDRFDSATVLETFGDKCHTAFVVSKGGFPFRDRGFYVASIVVKAPGVPSLSQQNTAEGDVLSDSISSNSSRKAIFCVSASFSPASLPLFPAAKHNPQALPVGRVFVDGWVLQTLDPYTTAGENYAIPSARCARLVAVDHAGSVPAAVNALVNGALARAVLAVEVYVKSRAPLPITRMPAAGFVVNERRRAEMLAGAAWKVRVRDESRALLAAEFDPEKQVYRCTVIISLVPSVPQSPSVRPEETTPRIATLALNNTRSRTTSDSDQSQSSSDDPTSATATPRSGSGFASIPSTPARPRSTSAYVRSQERAALRGSSSAFTLRGEVRPAADFVAAEVVVDTKLYPGGYSVATRSRIREPVRPLHLAASDHAGDAPGDGARVLPISFTVHTLPSSPLHSAGLSADRPPRHLLRLLLPTAQYQISTVQDPLTGETQSAPPKPQWLIDLQEKGAVVDVEIAPADDAAPPQRGKATTAVVWIDGTEVPVAGEKESLTSLGREELQDDRLSRMPTLSRMSNEAGALPEGLKSPVAVAERFLDPAVVASLTKTGQEAKDALEEEAAASEASEEVSGTPPNDKNLLGAVQTANDGSGGLLSFLGHYHRALSMFKSALQSAPSDGRTSPVSDANGDTRQVSVSAARAKCMYPLSTVIIVALIGFLIGSLLRSLLSPADFIYVVSDLKEAEEVEKGWREIKRLLEVKYLAGGWDFQIAVVRRH